MDTDYAAEFAQLALQLHNEPDVEHTVQRVVDGGLRAVNCDMASVMLVHGGSSAEIGAATNPLAQEADQLQMEVGEGPCLAAIRGAARSVVIQDPAGADVAAMGTHGRRTRPAQRSQRRLRTSSSTVGALNLYGRDADRFDLDDEAIAHILALHASIAVASAQQQASLSQAIDARKQVGQAQGILMERFGLDAGQAFAVLRRYSQNNNVKLREVAQRLISTRRLPD
jgi:transcriptional regulator with GAF, ATPase, and Fis domain